MNIDILIVGGGGGGGQTIAGGGGGGQCYEAAAQNWPIGTVATITIGAGGAGGNGGQGNFVSGQAGGQTLVTATNPPWGPIGPGGGGYGGGFTSAGGAGFSGGGGGGNAMVGGTGTHIGGEGSGTANGGGGGAGHTANGLTAFSTGGAGGAGYTTSISGTAIMYGSGGGGGARWPQWAPGAGAAGAGSGGGSTQALRDGTPGVANRGGGGGGGGHDNGTNTNGYGGAGGSGVVVIRYLTADGSATGGTITTSGAYTVHTFTGNGTFTVVAPTLTSITTVGGGAAQGFLGQQTRVTLTGTNFAAGATVNVSGGMTVSSVSVTSATAIAATFTGTALGTYNVSVTSSGITTAALTFTVLAVTVLPSAGLIVNQVLGSTTYNGHPGALGFFFTVGSQDRLVTALGRWRFASNTRKHDLWLRDANWNLIARAVVDLSSGAADQWVYATLPTPVVVNANQQYSVQDMGVVSGGDIWSSIAPVVTDGKGTANGTNVEVSSMFSFVRSADRTDAYSVGFRFTATAAYTVAALGRWKIAGNSLAHRIVLKDAAGTILRSGTVDFTGGKGIVDQFNYAPIPVIQLTAGATYYVQVEESGADVWPNYPNTITPWGGLTHTGGAYGPYPATDAVPTVDPVANQMLGACDVLVVQSAPSTFAEAYVTTNLQWKSAFTELAAQTSFRFSTAVSVGGGAILSAASALRFSTTVAAPSGGAILAAMSSMAFMTSPVELTVPEVWHPFYGAQVNKTSGLLIHGE